MPFKGEQKSRIPDDPSKGCLWCGWRQSFLDGVHLVDEISQPSVNGALMCKNCHAVFEDVFRPRLFKALIAFRPELEPLLPPSWKKCNKYSEQTGTAE